MKKQLGLYIVILVFIPLILSAYTGEIVKSFNTPAFHATGITFDGMHIWVADRKTDLIYCVDTATGKTIRSISTPAYWSTGIAWDGEYLWNADVRGGVPMYENFIGKIYKIDSKNGNILKTIQAPSNSPIGLAWDGKYLWCADPVSDEIIQFSAEDGTTIRTLKSPASDPNGIAFDGIYLWITDRNKNEIYMMDPENGCVIIIAEAPGPYTNSLCYDGKHLWASDYQNDKLYQLKIHDAALYKISNEKKSKVTYTYTINNFGPGNVNSIDVHFAIPANRANQIINGPITYSPKYTDIVTDQWGQKTTRFHFEKMKSGESKEIQMVSNITTYDVRYFIYPNKVGALSTIPDSIKKLFLANNEKYQYDDTIITNALKKAIGTENNPYWIARNIYNYIHKHMYYEMVGGWNTAPTVLSRGNGSCSEYSFLYISMCRAAGIPARYVGAVVERGEEASMDNVFHRWVEVYLPGYGWIPVDPSGGDKTLPRDQADCFGALSNRFYITTQSGGGSETLGWSYNSYEFWSTDPHTFMVYENFADWEPIK